MCAINIVEKMAGRGEGQGHYWRLRGWWWKSQGASQRKWHLLILEGKEFKGK